MEAGSYVEKIQETKERLIYATRTNMLHNAASSVMAFRTRAGGESGIDGVEAKVGSL